MTKRPARAIGVLTAIAAIAAAAVSCNGNGADDPIRASGYVEATEVRVAPEVGGRVVELAVQEGDRVEQGALMSYGMDFADGEDRVAAILDQVLRGANPATIPFELPDRPSFEWNRATAKAIAVELPPAIALRVTRFVD